MTQCASMRRLTCCSHQLAPSLVIRHVVGACCVRHTSHSPSIRVSPFVFGLPRTRSCHMRFDAVRPLTRNNTSTTNRQGTNTCTTCRDNVRMLTLVVPLFA